MPETAIIDEDVILALTDGFAMDNLPSAELILSKNVITHLLNEENKTGKCTVSFGSNWVSRRC
jgi:hypothetical protein